MPRRKQWPWKVTSPVPSDDEADAGSDDSEYEVEFVYNHRRKGGVVEYLVHWLGWGEEVDSWQSDQDVAGCPALVDAYWGGEAPGAREAFLNPKSTAKKRKNAHKDSSSGKQSRRESQPHRSSALPKGRSAGGWEEDEEDELAGDELEEDELEEDELEEDELEEDELEGDPESRSKDAVPGGDEWEQEVVMRQGRSSGPRSAGSKASGSVRAPSSLQPAKPKIRNLARLLSPSDQHLATASTSASASSFPSGRSTVVPVAVNRLATTSRPIPHLPPSPAAATHRQRKTALRNTEVDFSGPGRRSDSTRGGLPTTPSSSSSLHPSHDAPSAGVVGTSQIAGSKPLKPTSQRRIGPHRKVVVCVPRSERTSKGKERARTGAHNSATPSLPPSTSSLSSPSSRPAASAAGPNPSNVVPRSLPLPPNPGPSESGDLGSGSNGSKGPSERTNGSGATRKGKEVERASSIASTSTYSAGPILPQIPFSTSRWAKPPSSSNRSDSPPNSTRSWSRPPSAEHDSSASHTNHPHPATPNTAPPASLPPTQSSNSSAAPSFAPRKATPRDLTPSEGAVPSPSASSNALPPPENFEALTTASRTYTILLASASSTAVPPHSNATPAAAADATPPPTPAPSPLPRSNPVSSTSQPSGRPLPYSTSSQTSESIASMLALAQEQQVLAFSFEANTFELGMVGRNVEGRKYLGSEVKWAGVRFDWEEKIEKVARIEVEKGGQRVCCVLWTDDSFSRIPDDIVNIRAPQKVLAYYRSLHNPE